MINNPAMLVMDNYSCHISFAVYPLLSHPVAKENGVWPVTLIHTDLLNFNHLTELSLGLLRALTATYSQTGCMNTSTQCFRLDAGIAQTAFHLAFTRCNILSDFRRYGIHPMNPDIFTEEDFAACEVSDRPFNPVTNDSYKSDIAESPN